MKARCLFLGHAYGMAWHSRGPLWCKVGYECKRCGQRMDRHEDHWNDRHAEKGWT